MNLNAKINRIFTGLLFLLIGLLLVERGITENPSSLAFSIRGLTFLPIGLKSFISATTIKITILVFAGFSLGIGLRLLVKKSYGEIWKKEKTCADGKVYNFMPNILFRCIAATKHFLLVFVLHLGLVLISLHAMPSFGFNTSVEFLPPTFFAVILVYWIISGFFIYGFLFDKYIVVIDTSDATLRTSTRPQIDLNSICEWRVLHGRNTHQASHRAYYYNALDLLMHYLFHYISQMFWKLMTGIMKVFRYRVEVAILNDNASKTKIYCTFFSLKEALRFHNALKKTLG